LWVVLGICHCFDFICNRLMNSFYVPCQWSELLWCARKLLWLHTQPNLHEPSDKHCYSSMWIDRDLCPHILLDSLH
jgi:hypothetical protein